MEKLENQLKLAVVGDENSILLYRVIGAETISVIDDKEARDMVASLAAEHFDDEAQSPVYAVIFVEESFYKNLPSDLLDRFAKKPLPAVIPIPSPNANGKSFAVKRLSSIVERAIGSDIFNN